MIIYSITNIIKKEVEEEWVKWMQDVHIPDVVATGHFAGSELFKIKIPESQSGEVSYVVNYECKSFEEYLLYIKNDAPRLREDYNVKFAGKAGTARTVMEKVK
jgi:Domain of unknown function (DUF4286)